MESAPVVELNESGADAMMEVEERRPREEVEKRLYPPLGFPTRIWLAEGSVESPVPP